MLVLQYFIEKSQLGINCLSSGLVHLSAVVSKLEKYAQNCILGVAGAAMQFPTSFQIISEMASQSCVLLLHWLAKRIWRKSSSSCFHLFDCAHALLALLCYLATKWLYLQDTSKKVKTSQARYYDENLSTTCLDLLLSSRWTKARVIPWTMSFVELTKYLSIHLSRNKWWKKKKNTKK